MSALSMPATARRRAPLPWLRPAAVVALLVLGVGAGVLCARTFFVRPVPVAAGPFVPVVVPEAPTDGVVAFTIPKGAAAAQQRGGEAYVMPPVMRLRVGDEVVVRNEDDYPHIIFWSLVMPGTTTRMRFDTPGTEAYSSGCTANGGTLNSFTTVIVSEA